MRPHPSRYGSRRHRHSDIRLSLGIYAHPEGIAIFHWSFGYILRIKRDPNWPDWIEKKTMMAFQQFLAIEKTTHTANRSLRTFHDLCGDSTNGRRLVALLLDKRERCIQRLL